MHRYQTIAILFTLLSVVISGPARAATVGINPPSDPVTVAATELQLTTGFSQASITPPGSVTLTMVVTNTGAMTANNVAIDNLLPVEFSYTKGIPTELKNLGDLAPGDSIGKTYAITIPASVATNRYVDEVIASATNADSIEAIAALNITNGQVLGASDATLAATGTSPLVFILLGLMLIGFGIFQLRRQVT